MERGSNPVFREESFARSRAADVMTVNGVVNKSSILLAIVIAAAWYVWTGYPMVLAPTSEGQMVLTTNPGMIPFLLAGIFGGFAVSLVVIFNPAMAPFLAPVYAVLEGLALGGISQMFEQKYPGIVIQSTVLTFATLGTMLMIYRSKMIEVTDQLRYGIVAATGAIAVVYLIDLILMAFTSARVPLLHESGLMGIGISLVIVGVAAFNLLLDFDFIDRCIARRADKKMEWYASFGLLVTLVWLYLEILRLLSKLRSKD